MFGMKTSSSRDCFWDIPDGNPSWRLPNGMDWDQYKDSKVPYVVANLDDIIRADIKAGKMVPFTAYYDNYGRSLTDRLHWDRYNGIGFVDVVSYMTEVQSKGYAEDKSYVQKWLNIYNQLELEDVQMYPTGGTPPPPPPSGGSGVASSSSGAGMGVLLLLLFMGLR